MYRLPLHAVISCLLVLTACLLDYGIGKIPVAHAVRLPIESFPSKFDGWQGSAPIPVDSILQARLPTAKIVERTYADKSGNKVDLTLVTAGTSVDIHDPTVCFPAQGWTIVSNDNTVVAGQQLHAMYTTQDGDSLNVDYWFTGFYPPAAPSNALQRSLSHLRSKIISEYQGDSMLVRIVAAPTDCSADGMKSFITTIMPSVRKLVDYGRRSRS